MPMVDNILGKVRRSAAVMNFGPGSVVDFRADGAPVSAVAAGLEEWDKRFPPAGLANPQKIAEPRLQRKLLVGGFRVPPVVDENWRDDNGNPDTRSLVAARFPEWLLCPQCNRIAPANSWAQVAGRTYRYCAGCTATNPGQREEFVVPTRFVMACDKGHLDDFPWHLWVRHAPDCEEKERARLQLRAERPGLAGLILRCRSCKASRSMDGIFSAGTWQGVRCRGRRPWLAGANEDCDARPRALQRGASNLYFPVIESALSIPPWTDRLQQALGTYWHLIVETQPADQADFVRILARGKLSTALAELNLSADDLIREVKNRLEIYSDDATLDIRGEEYRQLSSDTTAPEAEDFEVRNVAIPERLRPFFARVVRVVRLREVRALNGFTRINPPDAEDSSGISPLSAARKEWLPAIEVRGEGIFLAFNLESLRSWEKQDRVMERARKVDDAWKLEWRERHGEAKPSRSITPRFLMVHTFSHALMRQLTLESGYSTAALRERLYVDEDPEEMAGVLIYTATSGSDGTLGGLQRQGESLRAERAVVAAIRAMEWCSSDPLCIEGMISAADRLSLAACHACVMAPETACEEYNRFLDRSTLVGLPGNPEAGFFSNLLEEPVQV